jgi:hypothetical protein
MHSIETILGLVGASLVVKLIEKCSDKYCQNEEVQQVIHEVEQEINEDILHHEDYHDLETTRTLTPRSNTSTVYNFAVQPTKLLNK